ncbi:MAG: glycosyltransferase family 39 protein, partial [bacterium]|nr:glycosyltransferase family 39 protein [bacterium]
MVFIKKIEVPGAWLAALIFALHPVHVESVAWIIERKDVLSTFFYLASFILFVDYQKYKQWKRYLLSILLFLCAVLSKSMTISLPIAFILYLWWKNHA